MTLAAIQAAISKHALTVGLVCAVPATYVANEPIKRTIHKVERVVHRKPAPVVHKPRPVRYRTQRVPAPAPLTLPCIPALGGGGGSLAGGGGGGAISFGAIPDLTGGGGGGYLPYPGPTMGGGPIHTSPSAPPMTLAPPPAPLEPVLTSSAPEPATWLMLFAGFGMAGLALRLAPAIRKETAALEAEPFCRCGEPKGIGEIACQSCLAW